MSRKKSLELPWHSDFRDASKLPDIKAVRSVFFVSVAPIIVAVLLFFWWIFIEWQILGIGAQTRDDEKKAAAMQKTNDELLKQSAEFEKWAKIINEIQGFVSIPAKPSALLVAIGQVRPAGLTLSQISSSFETRAIPQKKEEKKEEKKEDDKPKSSAPKTFAVYVVNITGSLSGTAAQATKSIESFQEKLASMDIFKDRTFNQKPTLKTFDRDKGLDVYRFSISFEVKQ
jgi:hypothetical protein